MAQASAPAARRKPATRRPTMAQVVLLFAVVVAVAAFFGFGLGRGFTLEAVQANEQRLLALREHSPLVFAAAYLLLYVGTTALSVPGAAVLTVAAGALFGLVQGTARCWCPSAQLPARRWPSSAPGCCSALWCSGGFPWGCGRSTADSSVAVAAIC